MTTKTLQARRIDTTESIVTGGEQNELDAGERRRVWRVCECRHVDGRSEFRLRPLGAGAWRTVAVASTTRLRVLT